MLTYTLGQAQASQGQKRHWLYNLLDTVGTRRVLNTLKPLMTPGQDRWYRFQMAAQTPAMKMASRGMLVDTYTRDDVVKELKDDAKEVFKRIQVDPRVKGVWDGTEKETGLCKLSKRKDGRHTWDPEVDDGPERKCTQCGHSRLNPSPFNPKSSPAVMHLLYDLHGLRRQYNKEGEVTADDEALVKIRNQYPKYGPFVEDMRSYRDLTHQVSFLSTSLNPQDRFPSSFNVGAAWTDRWSSSEDVFGYGGNAQNITERHRRMFIADPGKVLVYADLKQAESNIVAHMAGDDAYIQAHKSGDVHTFVTRLIWPGMAWTGDLKQDKAIAKTLPDWDPVEGHDFRWQSKRIQHGSNYGLTPFGMSIISHTKVEANRAAQRAYFRGFPLIRSWQRWTREEVMAQRTLISPLGREVRLFGRPLDEHTYKQGLAVGPQGTVAHIIDMAAWRLEREFDPERIELLAQVHDALVWQQDPDDLETLYRAAALMMIPLPVVDFSGHLRYAQIEAEIAMGQNWGHFTSQTDVDRAIAAGQKPPVLNLDGIVEIHIPKEYYPDGF